MGENSSSSLLIGCWGDSFAAMLEFTSSGPLSAYPCERTLAGRIFKLDILKVQQGINFIAIAIYPVKKNIVVANGTNGPPSHPL